MYLKKEATVLISTVIILSLMSMLGCFIYKMMRNNTELSTLYKFDRDIYDLDKHEEEILNEFMGELNKTKTDNLNGLEDENNIKYIFSQDFIKKIKDSSIEYYKNDDKIFLITKKDNQIIRKREIVYIFRDEKIILVPTYKFENNSE